MTAKLPQTLLLSGAAQGGESVLKALATDLLIIKKRVPGRGKRGLKSTPTDVEFHVNPLGIGCLAVGAGLAAWLLQLRATPYETNVGKWFWPSDNTVASKELIEELQGAAPMRLYDLETRPKQEDYDSYLAYWAADVAWVATHTEYATWRTTGKKTKVGVAQRAGYGSGLGIETDIGTISPIFKVEGWWDFIFPFWGPFVHKN